jgi:hypothetical protein
MSVEIRPVQSKAELKTFIKFPWQIYKNDENWVPPLILDIKTILDKRKNPFFLHSDAQPFIAFRNGKVAGRIVAIINNNHNNVHNEKTGFFGFFECFNDQEIANALFAQAEVWIKEKGMQALRGPTNLTTNDPCALLTEGFDEKPVILMTYNPQYYLDLFSNAGFKVVKGMYAYQMIEKDHPFSERFVKFANKVHEDKSITIRNINLKKFDQEVEIVFQIYNDAWQHNWGFVPLTKEEFKHMAKDLKTGIDPDIVFVAEVNGEPAAFSLALPDYNQIFKDINGRLFPFGLIKLLLNKHKISCIRVLTLGVRPKFQKKRILAPALYYETYRRGTGKGYCMGEFGWILEDNVLMNRALEGMGAKLHKKYAIYERPVAGL